MKPANTLRINPTVANRDDLNQALSELANLDARRREVAAALDSDINRLKSQAEDDLQLTIDGQAISTTERIEMLEAAIRDYAAPNKEELLPDNSKTLKLPNGSLQWKGKRLSISYAEGEDSKSIVARFDKRTKFLNSLIRTLSGIACGSFCLSDLFEIKATFSKTKALTALKEGRLTKNQLGRNGINVVGGGTEEQIVINVNQVDSRQVSPSS